VTQETIGWIVAVYSITQIFAAPIVGNNLDRIGRANGIKFGIMNTFTQLTIFGTLTFIHD